MLDIKLLAREIKKHDSFLLSVHINPDGDCVGSVLALEKLLEKLNKKTQIVCDSNIPETLSFLPKGSWLNTGEYQNNFHAEMFISLDTPNLDRLGKSKEYFHGAGIINIDHHVSNKQFGSFNYIDQEASACGEIIFELFEYLKIPIDHNVAKLLYVSIATDTGSFKYSNTTAKTHRIAAKIIESGLDVEATNLDIYGKFEDSRLNLIELLLKKRQMAYGRKLCYAILSHEELKATGGKPEDFEGAVDFIRDIKGVKAAFILTEWESGKFKISFRSSSDVDVNKIANKIQGGGHKKAAGGRLTGDINEATKKTLSLFENVLK